MTGDLSGTRLAGRYRVVEGLARGGMGEVWVAVDENLGRRVAVKLIRPELGADPGITERLRREAVAVGALAHPHIVQTTDFGFAEEHGGPFLVMELLEGELLAMLLRRERTLPPERAVGIVDQILDALGAAHAAGVVHRDLKPANVFLTRLANVTDVVKLLDFGIAKLQESEAYRTLTKTGQIIGTPAWMAPEQARGEPLDGRTDLFAAGLILYRALAGRLPYDVSSDIEFLIAVQEQHPPSLVAAGVDPRLDGVVRKALSKHPSARWQTAAEMRDALRPWIGAGARPRVAAADNATVELDGYAVRGDAPTVAAGALPETRPSASAAAASAAPRDAAPRPARDEPVVERAGRGSRRWLWASVAAIALVVLVAGGVVAAAVLVNDEPTASAPAPPTPVAPAPTSPSPSAPPPTAHRTEPTLAADPAVADDPRADRPSTMREGPTGTMRGPSSAEAEPDPDPSADDTDDELIPADALDALRQAERSLDEAGRALDALDALDEL